MENIIAWFTTNWVNVVAALWTVDQFLKIVAPLTPWKMDDNVADWVGRFLKQFFPKGQ